MNNQLKLYINTKGSRILKAGSYATHSLQWIKIDKICFGGKTAIVVNVLSGRMKEVPMSEITPINIFAAEIADFSKPFINQLKVYTCSDDVIDKLAEHYHIETVLLRPDEVVIDLDDYIAHPIPITNYFDMDKVASDDYKRIKESTIQILFPKGSETPENLVVGFKELWEMKIAKYGYTIPIDRTIDWGWLAENFWKENQGKPNFQETLTTIKNLARG